MGINHIKESDVDIILMNFQEGIVRISKSQHINKRKTFTMKLIENKVRCNSSRKEK